MNLATSREAPVRVGRTRPEPAVPSGVSAHPGPHRHHAIDALRGAAMFLVVTLHSALAYTRLDIPRLNWGTREPSQLGFDLFCWWAMGVSLPLFFTIGGFFAAELYRTRGALGLLQNRAARIAAPFAAACVVVLPWCFLAWASGWLVTGRCTLREIRRMKFHAPGIQDELYGPAHLWFLEYLILMLLVFVALRALRPRRGSDLPEAGRGWMDRWLASAWRPLLPAIPTALILWLSREHSGIDAALDRHNSFVPELFRLLHHGLFFAVGVRLNRFRGALERFSRPGPLYLALALPVFLARAWLLPTDWSTGLSPAWGLVLAALGAAFAWLTLFGFLGVFLRQFDRPRPAVRHLADASYWVYLIHFPIVGFAQADLYGVPLPAWLKFAAVLGLTLVLGLSSYRALVRYSVMGRWLHGPRSRPEPTRGPGPHVAPRRTTQAIDAR